MVGRRWGEKRGEVGRWWGEKKMGDGEEIVERWTSLTTIQGGKTSRDGTLQIRRGSPQTTNEQNRPKHRVPRLANDRIPCRNVANSKIESFESRNGKWRTTRALECSLQIVVYVTQVLLPSLLPSLLSPPFLSRITQLERVDTKSIPLLHYLPSPYPYPCPYPYPHPI